MLPRLLAPLASLGRIGLCGLVCAWALAVAATPAWAEPPPAGEPEAQASARSSNRRTAAPSLRRRGEKANVAVVLRSIGRVYELLRADGAVESVQRFSQDVQVRAHGPLGDDELPVRAVFRGRYDVDFGLLSSARVELPWPLRDRAQQLSLLQAYVEAEQWWGCLDWRVGRQLFVDATGWRELDGAWARLSPWSGLELGLFAGDEVLGGVESFNDAAFEPVARRADDAKRLHLVGGSLAWRARWLRAELAYQQSFAELAQSAGARLGLAAESRPVDWLGLFGRAVLEPLLGTLATAELGLDLRPHADWQLRTSWQRSDPVFALDSIFNVFAHNAHDELDLRVTWTGLRDALFSLALGAGFDEDPDDATLLDASLRVRALAQWSPRPWRALLSLDGSFAEHGQRYQARLLGEAPELAELVRIGASLYGLWTEGRLRERLDGLAMGASLQSTLRIPDAGELELRLEAHSTPLVDHELRATLLLDLGFWL